MGCTVDELEEMLELYEQYKKTKICSTCKQSITINNWVNKHSQNTNEQRT